MEGRGRIDGLTVVAVRATRMVKFSAIQHLRNRCQWLLPQDNRMINALALEPGDELIPQTISHSLSLLLDRLPYGQRERLSRCSAQPVSRVSRLKHTMAKRGEVKNDQPNPGHPERGEPTAFTRIAKGGIKIHAAAKEGPSGEGSEATVTMQERRGRRGKSKEEPHPVRSPAPQARHPLQVDEAIAGNPPSIEARSSRRRRPVTGGPIGRHPSRSAEGVSRIKSNSNLEGSRSAKDLVEALRGRPAFG